MHRLEKKTVFDLGFHNGDDTHYYLSSGYKVIAVEANPLLVKKGAARFSSEITNGNLVILNNVISDSNRKSNFYINTKKTNISSVHQSIAEHDGSKSNKIEINSINLEDIINRYGVPYYIKTDIEGADSCVAKSLYNLKFKPKFVSFETSRTFYATIFSWLYLSGYKKFQLINQINNPQRTGDYKFSHNSSGPFGPHLEKGKWIDFDEMLSRYIKFIELRKVDALELSIGWLDIHAKQ